VAPGWSSGAIRALYALTAVQSLALAQDKAVSNPGAGAPSMRACSHLPPRLLLKMAKSEGMEAPARL
jgi:hypothetical protein